MQPELRTATPTDAPVIAALCNSVTRELYGTGDANAQEVRTWFDFPDLGAFAVEADGRMLGYADVRVEGRRVPIDVRVAPAARGDGVADILIHACEEWARPRARRGAAFRGFTAERDREVIGALERAGYRLIRHSLHMHIDLPEDVSPPVWPDGITVRQFDPERDEREVYECVMDTFADHWDFERVPIDRWRQFNMRGGDFHPELWWLAEDDGQLAGVSLNAWHFSGDPRFGWIGTLGVRRPWRRRGLGLALLQHSFADFKHRGATQVGLGVDAENLTGAVRLYERAGMRVARRNDQYEKAL